MVGVIDTWGYVKKNRGRQVRTEPVEPEKVLKIIQMREEQKMCWREIAEHMGMTHQGSYLLYKRWREWAHTERMTGT
jgi:hypothetical protein